MTDEIISLAVELFDGEAAAARWLTRPLEMLGGRTPLQALGDPRAREILRERLLRAEWGVYG